VTENFQGSSILVVDDTPENLHLLTSILKRGGLVPRPVLSGKLAIEAAAFDPPDLILLDISMPDMSGLDVCKWLKQDERLRNIPVIFISGSQGIQDKIEAFHVGGVDYVSKPFQAQEVLARLKTHLRLSQLQTQLISDNLHLEKRIAEKVKEVTASQLATIFALARLAETRDDETGQHIERVQIFSRVLAEKMQEMRMYPTQLTSAFIEHLQQTASLHDIGKVGVQDAILLKPGKLTSTEFAVMKTHCILGSNTLTAVLKRFPDNQFLRMGVAVARSHHEKWDGSGYPDGLKGEEIPLAARIVALADFYDAMTSRRCYRPEFSHKDTCSIIRESSGTHFPPDLVTSFMKVEPIIQRIRNEMQGVRP
jgi:putative two-component system response regulator